MAFNAQQTIVAELSQAAYGRVLAKKGLDFYADHLEAGTMTADSIREDFMSNPEAAIRYPESATNDATVQQVFNNVLGRDAADTGVAHYSALLAAGTIDKSELVSMILKDAKGLSGADATFINTAVATGETAYAAEVATEEAATEEAANAGETFSLTTDTDAITGTEKNDTITAVVSSLSSEATIGTKDTIDGAEGTDTLNIDLKGTFSGLGADGSIKNVENINLTNDTVIDRTFDATNITGVEKYTIDTTKAVSLTNLVDTGAEVEIKNAQNDSTISFGSKTDLTATTDAMSLTLDNVGAAKVLNADGTTKTAENDVKINMAKIEEVTVTTKNTASFLDASGMDATTLAANGDVALTVSAVKDGLTTFDASAMTASVTADFTGVATANSIKTINTGSADDSITIDAADVVANASIAGGTGADTLTLKDSGTSTTQYAMSGVETLALSNTSATTFSAKNISDLSTIQINDSTDGKTAATATTSLVNLGGADMTIETVGATNTGADLTLDNSGTVTVNMNASSANTAAKNTGIALAGSESMGAVIDASNASNVTVNVDAGVKYAATATVSAAKATAVTLKVDTLLNAATTPTEQTAFNGKIIAAKATDLTIDAKGKVSVAGLSDLTAVQTATIIAGDTVTLGANKLEKASSVVVSGENKESAVSLAEIGTDGTTAVDYNVTVNASGLKAGFSTKSIASQQTLKVDVNDTTGNVSMDALVGANVTLEASTLDGDLAGTSAATSLTIDSTAAAAATATATVNVHDNAGTINVGNIGTTNSFKTITVDAGSNTDTVTIGDITATGTAKVILKDNLNTSTIGAITGKDVVVDAGNALKAVTIKADDGHTSSDDIIITDSLTYTAGLVGANATNGVEVAITADIANATSTTVTLNGNIGNDKFFIDGGNNNNKDASIVVKGDLDIGTNNVAVTSAIAGSGKATIDLSGLTGAGATTISVTGGAGDDTITLSDLGDTVTGGAGADIITGGAGNDVFKEVAASIVSGEKITGGAGTDTLFITNAATADLTNLDSSVDDLVGEASIENLIVKHTAITLDEAISGTDLAINTDSAVNLNMSIIMSGTTLDLSKITYTAMGDITSATETALTASSDSFIITGSSANDTITLSDLGDTVTGGAGNDTITLGAGADTVTTSVGAAYAAGNIDTIKSFTVGASGDNIEIDISDVEAIATVGNLTDGGGADENLGAGASVIQEVALNSAGTDLNANTALVDAKSVIVLTGHTNGTVTLEDIVDDGAGNKLSWAATGTSKDAIIIVYSDGTDAHIVAVADAGTDVTWDDGDTAVTEIATLSGITNIEAGDFNAANFDFIA